VRGLAARRLELERELPVCPGDLSDDVARRDAGAAVVAGRDALAVVRATNAVRIATSFSARLFNLFITNVSGVQKQMYVAGTKPLETYAVPPLLPNQVLAIGVTSYNRHVVSRRQRRPGSDERSRRAAEPAVRFDR
jgi:WS/DGAT C-terminal domain